MILILDILNLTYTRFCKHQILRKIDLLKQKTATNLAEKYIPRANNQLLLKASLQIYKNITDSNFLCHIACIKIAPVVTLI